MKKKQPRHHQDSRNDGLQYTILKFHTTIVKITENKKKDTSEDNKKLRTSSTISGSGQDAKEPTNI